MFESSVANGWKEEGKDGEKARWMDGKMGGWMNGDHIRRRGRLSSKQEENQELS